MENQRSYPSSRRQRGELKLAQLTMLSARIDDELYEYVKATAHETRRSKQDIVAEALRMHRESRQAPSDAE